METSNPPNQPSRPKVSLFFTAGAVASCAIIYLAGLTCFFKWEERALTQAEYFRRVTVRNKVYAPIVWLKGRDPSGALKALIQWEYRICHKESFNAVALP